MTAVPATVDEIHDMFDREGDMVREEG